MIRIAMILLGDRLDFLGREAVNEVLTGCTPGATGMGDSGAAVTGKV